MPLGTGRRGLLGAGDVSQVAVQGGLQEQVLGAGAVDLLDSIWWPGTESTDLLGANSQLPSSPRSKWFSGLARNL